MKSALVFALVFSLITPSLSFAGQSAPTQPWSDVQSWKPGWEVTEVSAASGLRRFYFIAADSTGMTLLNVSDATLPANVVKTLRRAIVDHPGYFPVADSVTFKLDDRVSLTSVGVFVADQKIADYDRIVQRIERADVVSGIVHLDAKRSWSNTKQILVTIGLVFAAGAAAVVIVCATQRCD